MNKTPQAALCASCLEQLLASIKRRPGATAEGLFCPHTGTLATVRLDGRGGIVYWISAGPLPPETAENFSLALLSVLDPISLKGLVDAREAQPDPDGRLS
jgi:hypothetical protein